MDRKSYLGCAVTLLLASARRLSVSGHSRAAVQYRIGETAARAQDRAALFNRT
jgi:hypothetical protein